MKGDPRIAFCLRVSERYAVASFLTRTDSLGAHQMRQREHFSCNNITVCYFLVMLISVYSTFLQVLRSPQRQRSISHAQFLLTSDDFLWVSLGTAHTHIIHCVRHVLPMQWNGNVIYDLSRQACVLSQNRSFMSGAHSMS